MAPPNPGDDGRGEVDEDTQLKRIEKKQDQVINSIEQLERKMPNKTEMQKWHDDFQSDMVEAAENKYLFYAESFQVDSLYSCVDLVRCYDKTPEPDEEVRTDRLQALVTICTLLTLHCGSR